ncbi:MAG: class I SAM-dependent methyltransferase, partial [Chloroflexota bacterium]
MNGKNTIKTLGDYWRESTYYAEAEKTTWIWWWPNGAFLPYFERMDKRITCELACGHGRHLPNYRALCDDVILVDVNRENINVCKARFAGDNGIRYIVN